MATGPGDERAAGGRGHLRASHADREQVIGTLKAAFVQGRLTKDELDARAGQAFAARTYAELAALTADLPAGLADAVPPRRVARAQARRPMNNAARAGLWVVIAVAVPVVLSFLIGGVAFLLFTPFYFAALAFLGAEMLVSWPGKSSRRGQLPPGLAPGPGGPVSQRPPSVGPGGQIPPAGHDPRPTAEAARRRLPLLVRGRCAGGVLAAGTAPASG
jgi:Domain of unknown function (DUF1707)